MPNWVFNTLDGYSKDLYNRYRSEDKDIDFDKIIPEPEEIKNTISGSYNTQAKNIVAYREYIQNKKNSNDNSYYLKYDSKNPLKEPVSDLADRTCRQMGELAIENPDDSLNTILADENNKHCKYNYDEYVKIFGNRAYDHIPKSDMEQVYDNYCDNVNEQYKRFIEKHMSETPDIPDNIEDYGKHLNMCQEKYGFDNWYDWRNANWGTKWNACETSYDPETESVKFDTAWSIPYPIISKIAYDNPDVNIDGCSDEETGWFDEYNLHNGKVNVTCHGEYEWDENDQVSETREDCNEIYEYPTCRDESIAYWKNFTNINILKK